MDFGSFKDFEEVRLKATYNIEIGDRTIEEGETILFFDKIQIAGFKELVNRVSANGGFDNRARVYWDTTKELQLSFTQGVFSKEQFALMSNSKLINLTAPYVTKLTKRECLESDQNRRFVLQYEPDHQIYIYNRSTGQKIEGWTRDGKQIQLPDPYFYTDVIVDYEYDYSGDIQIVNVGQRLIKGFLSLEGKTRVKDDTTGQIITGLIVIPRLRLMSDLSMRLGAQANPLVASFDATCVPVGSRGQAHVMEFYYLSGDVDSDL